MTRYAVALVLIAAAYLLMLASADPVDVATAVVVGGVLLVAFRRFLFVGPAGTGPGLLTRLAALPLFLAAVLRDITVGTWEVALIVLHLRPLRRVDAAGRVVRAPGIVAVPFGPRTEQGAYVSAFVATLSPGEFLVDVDRERRVMLLHVIDAADPDAVRRRHEHFYERYQRRVFP
jgi:multicomponent Na+:H+ antiporter subunit E